MPRSCVSFGNRTPRRPLKDAVDVDGDESDGARTLDLLRALFDPIRNLRATHVLARDGDRTSGPRRNDVRLVRRDLERSGVSRDPSRLRAPSPSAPAWSAGQAFGPWWAIDSLRLAAIRELFGVINEPVAKRPASIPTRFPTHGPGCHVAASARGEVKCTVDTEACERRRLNRRRIRETSRPVPPVP